MVFWNHRIQKQKNNNKEKEKMAKEIIAAIGIRLDMEPEDFEFSDEAIDIGISIDELENI